MTNDGYDLEIFNKSFLNYSRQLLIISVDESLSKSLSLELTSEQRAALMSILDIETGPPRVSFLERNPRATR
jgi:hypothetical protein